MKKIILSALGAAVCCIHSYGLVINVTPGSLHGSQLLLSNTRDSELILKGSASAADLELLKTLSPSVKKLDISSLLLVYNAIPETMLIGSGIEQVVLPAKLASIGRSAFASSRIESIDIPEGVKSIGDNAFAGCPNLKEVTIGGTPTLGNGVFKGASALQKVDFVNGVEVIPAHTFENCTSYAAPLPVSVSEIGPYAFCGTALRSVDLSNVSVLGDFSFADCQSLVEITVNREHEMSVGKGAFFADSSVEMLPDMYGFYPQLVMAGTAGNDQLSVNGASIDKAAFANNNSVKTLRIGPDVAAVKAHAFRNMRSLETVNVTQLGENVPDTDELAFSGLENGQGRYDILLHVAEKTGNVWKAHPVWRLFNIVDGGADVGSVTEAALNVGVSRHAGSVYVSASVPVDMLGVYSLDGKTLHESRPYAETCEVDNLPVDEVLIVKVVTGGQIKVVKLI